MNIFHKIALQGLKKSRTRTFVTLIGVMLSAALITGIITFGISLLNYMVNGALSKYGDYHIAFFNVPASFIEDRSKDKEVKNITVIENIGYALYDNNNNHNGNTDNNNNSNHNDNNVSKKPYFFITGYNDNAFETLPVHLISGRLPKNSTEILISGNIIKAGISYSIGDIISLSIGSRINTKSDNTDLNLIEKKILGQKDTYYPEKEKLLLQEKKNYTIVGICQTPAFEDDSSPGYTLITKTDHQNYQSTRNDFNLFIKLKQPYYINSYLNNTKSSNYTYGTNDNVLRFLGASNDTSSKIFNTLLYSIGGIVVIIVMIGSIFLIHNAFQISLNERMHQFGILLSVGATEKQLRHSVLFEGFCIGAVSIPFGILLGLGGIQIVLSIVSEKFTNILYNNVELTMTISIPVLLLAAIISLITILISAYIPAKKAASTPVMECIRQTNEIKIESKAIKISKLTERIYGLEGILALKNFKRNKKRYRSIILSLVLSIVLFISTNSFIIDLQQASEAAVIYTTYDLGIDMIDMSDAEMLLCYDKLKTTDNASQSLYQMVAKYFCTIETRYLSEELKQAMNIKPDSKAIKLSADVQFLDDNTYAEEIKQAGISQEEYTGKNTKFIAIAKVDNPQNKVLEADEFKDMFSSSTISTTIVPNIDTLPNIEDDSITKPSKEITITAVSIEGNDVLPNLKKSDEPKPYIFTIIAPWSLKDSFQIPEECIGSKGITFCSKNPTQLEQEIENTIISLGITSNYIIYNTKKLFQENSNMIFIANVFAYTFIIMISLIAVANIFNTISTNIKLRRRELAMLRSIGISERSFQNMMNFECILYGLRALLFGLPIAILLSFLIYQGMSSGGADNIDFILPWASIGISVFSIFFIILITMLYSVRKIKKENIIDALRDDLI